MNYIHHCSLIGYDIDASIEVDQENGIVKLFALNTEGRSRVRKVLREIMDQTQSNIIQDFVDNLLNDYDIDVFTTVKSRRFFQNSFVPKVILDKYEVTKEIDILMIALSIDK